MAIAADDAKRGQGRGPVPRIGDPVDPMGGRGPEPRSALEILGWALSRYRALFVVIEGIFATRKGKNPRLSGLNARFVCERRARGQGMDRNRKLAYDLVSYEGFPWEAFRPSGLDWAVVGAASAH